ncbi:MAG: hypothetical protein H6825_08245 [Planctomycetes bacterium]|nr:hypothetical protein [Planctomycetota bacterium]
MNIFKKALGALQAGYLGGEVVTTVGRVEGEPAMGMTADLMKASGEMQVHVVRTPSEERVVVLELLQERAPGDGSDMVCVRLRGPEATRLSELLRRASEEAVRPGAATDTTSPRG